VDSVYAGQRVDGGTPPESGIPTLGSRLAARFDQ